MVVAPGYQIQHQCRLAKQGPLIGPFRLVSLLAGIPRSLSIPLLDSLYHRNRNYLNLTFFLISAVSEPPTCLAISVAFALREAIVSSREETGYPRTKWFNVGKKSHEPDALKTLSRGFP